MSGESSVVFAYLDESGNFDFSDRGTGYFVMTCITCRRPFTACHELMDLKYDCFEHGLIFRKFHACEDNAETRRGVFSVLGSNGEAYRASSFYVDKASLSDDAKDAAALYALAFDYLMGTIESDGVVGDGDRLVVITDTLPVEARRKQVIKPLKRIMKRRFTERGIRADLVQLPSESDLNLQIADYVCWAFMRKATGRGEWPFSQVEAMYEKRADRRSDPPSTSQPIRSEAPPGHLSAGRNLS